eukprot:846471-Ditylum_brightwellii.AAC.1
MEEHKDGKGSSGSEKSIVDMDDSIASASDFYSSSDISNDVKKGTQEKMKVKEGRKRKNIGRKPSSETPSQGKRTVVKKKMTKANMGEKGTSYKEKKTSSVDNNTTKEDGKRNAFQKVGGKCWSSASISSAGSSDNTSSQGKQSVMRKKKRIFKKGGKIH